VRLYPLRFYEIYKPKIWGGRALETVLGKSLPAGETVGESWELSDHFDDLSVVRNGALEGMTLRDVWRKAAADVLGRDIASKKPKEFPLLVKFIDAQEDLSLQVHPDEKYAREHDEKGEFGKNEAWYVITAKSGAELILGVREGTTKDQLKRLLDAGRIEEALSRTRVKAGDLVHVSAGTLHAIGAGILLCEIEESSDATYRVWDWGRTGEDGKPRPLHVNHALNVMDFARGPVKPEKPADSGDGDVKRQILDRCESFAIERIVAEKRFTETAPDGRFYIFVCVGGSGSIVAEGQRFPYVLGDTILVPAVLEPVAVEPAEPCTLLKTYVPRVES